MSVVALIFSLFGVSDPAVVAVDAASSPEPEPMRWYGVERMLAEFEAEGAAEAGLTG